jgi:V/A-type H+-transporting ATPase subunit I
LSAVQILNPLDLDPDGVNPVLNNTLIEAGNTHPIVALLGLCLVIGLVTVFVGYLLKMNTAIRSKEWNSLVSQLAWLGFLGSLFAWVIATAMGAAWEVGALIALTVFAVSLFVFNQGKGFVGKIVSGLGSLYGLISFGSDILSFTRLVAVGLTSGIIASVVNLLTFLVFDGINVPVLNVVVAALMLLIGHLFNLVIALFGAYINPLRLNYVEFYPKFFEGRGRQIKTLQTDFSYLRIQSN